MEFLVGGAVLLALLALIDAAAASWGFDSRDGLDYDDRRLEGGRH
jgi:hypothetical protein